MRAPAHWYRPRGPLATLLAPLGAAYAVGTARRLRRGARRRLNVPVICVGNLTAGGTGKTPMVIALAQHLAQRGIAAQALSRGHGGQMRGPVLVDPQRHSAQDVGDEPLLLSAFLPVWVARDRAAGAEAALAAGAQAILLDDGFQNPSLAHDLAIVVVDAKRGFGNGCVIPAGPLREPVATGLARADLLVTIGDGVDQDRFGRSGALSGAPHDLPRIRAVIEPIPTGLSLRDAPVLAFAGIGDPEKFFATLRGLGARLLRAIPLADHAPLTPALMTRILREAESLGALPVTTEKDAVRLPAHLRARVTTVPVRLTITDRADLDAAIARVFPD